MAGPHSQVSRPSGVQRPSDLQRAISNATQRVLTLQFNELAQHGLLGKTIFPQLPPKVEHYLTPLGESLLPVIDVLAQCDNAHRATLEAVLKATSGEASKVTE